MKLSKSLLIAAALALMAVIVVQAAGPTGAIFTTTPDGTIVNENVRYTQKIEVYLDGGPGPNAPQTAAGLDDGLYVFQVTDPSGKFLLSQDPAMCRVVEVKDGVISREVPATELGFASDTYTVGSKTYPCRILDGDPAAGVAGPSGRHDWNYDADHGPAAIVVQLMPFGDTPNPGGVYKAWMEKLQSYKDKLGDLSLVPVAIKGIGAKECPNFCANRDPGFGPANTDTKTDNFKVKKTRFISPEITVKKFHDKNANGVFDTGDEWVTGWQVDVTDPTALTNSVWTPATIVAEPYGLWSFLEETPAGTLQTASYVDGLPTNPFPTNPAEVTVAGTSGEKHEVVFGNVGLGTVTACKVYDRNGNGTPDAGEPPVVGWKMELTGTVANGEVIAPVDKYTGSDGCVTYDDLLPGDYTVTELFPSGNWVGSGPSSYDFTIVSTLDGSEMSGSSFTFTFTNYCVCTVGFNTKGYWHNKNGLTELTTADRDYVNGLLPYMAPSDYFGAGDEPFDGYFADGATPVDAAFNNDDGSLIWGQGTWQAEVSLFLVDPNAGGGGGDQEQLAQQLLAFIFNVRHRLGSPNVVIQVNGEWVSAQSIIDSAIAAWASPGTDDDKYWEPILDALNNNGAVPLIKYTPCAVAY